MGEMAELDLLTGEDEAFDRDNDLCPDCSLLLDDGYCHECEKLRVIDKALGIERNSHEPD